MLSIFETLGWLSRIQVFMTIFDYELSEKISRTKYILGFIRRIPIIVMCGYAALDVITIFYGELSFGSNDSRTSEAVSVIDLVVIKVSSLCITFYFIFKQKRHLKLIKEEMNFERKWADLLGSEVWRRRSIDRWKYNLRAILIFLYNFSYNYVLYLSLEEEQTKNLASTFWYIVLICQSANVDYVAFYISGYFNVFSMSLDAINLDKLPLYRKLNLLIFLTEYLEIVRKLNAVFVYGLLIVLVTRLVEASTTFYFLFVFTYDLPIDYIAYIAFFALCCGLWTIGNIFVMLQITMVGDYFKEKMNSTISKITASHEEGKSRKTTKDIVNLNTKIFLLKILHESEEIRIGQIFHINRYLLFKKTLTLLCSNLVIFVQFRQFELGSSLDFIENMEG
uniref:Uncharacterized protein n=1 Tax=Lutzomyia longipalpis TaxID=7200 RepID=A0A3F2ZDA8_LUTLO